MSPWLDLEEAVAEEFAAYEGLPDRSLTRCFASLAVAPPLGVRSADRVRCRWAKEFLVRPKLEAFVELAEIADLKRRARAYAHEERRRRHKEPRSAKERRPPRRRGPATAAATQARILADVRAAWPLGTDPPGCRPLAAIVRGGSTLIRIARQEVARERGVTLPEGPRKGRTSCR